MKLKINRLWYLGKTETLSGYTEIKVYLSREKSEKQEAFLHLPYMRKKLDKKRVIYFFQMGLCVIVYA